eukprot:1184099-Prorocentrum_minimum.AAC.1
MAALCEPCASIASCEHRASLVRAFVLPLCSHCAPIVRALCSHCAPIVLPLCERGSPRLWSAALGGYGGSGGCLHLEADGDAVPPLPHVPAEGLPLRLAVSKDAVLVAPVVTLGDVALQKLLSAALPQLVLVALQAHLLCQGPPRSLSSARRNSPCPCGRVVCELPQGKP